MSDIILYTGNTCPYCTITKNYLEENGLKYTEKNVHNSIEAKKELIEMGHKGVPVLVCDGEEIVGFNKEKMDELLIK